MLRKNNNYRFTGKYKQNDNATNYVFYRGGHYYQLTTKRIKGNDYFQIGKNQYIRVNNIQSIAGRLLTVSQTTATVTKETHLITASQSGSAVDTGKVLKKGQKFTVDAEIGLDVGANSIPNGYRIKGTNTYIWTKDARLRQNLTLQATSTTEFRTFTVRPPKDSLQFYNANGEKITPDGYFYPKHQLLGVDGKAYVWLPSQNKAVLCYHVVATNKTFDTEESAGHYQTKDLDLGNAFIPVADVEQYGGLKKLSTFNTAAQAKTDAETPASASELAKLKTEVAQAKTTKDTAKYRLSSGQTKQNYDTTITEVENLLRSERRLSAAEVKLYTWILATRTQDLYGEKVKVKSLKKLTKSEAELLNDILRDAYQNDPTAQKGTYTRLTYDRKQNKIYLETQDEKTGKIISLKEQPLTDYLTEK
ncbi:serine protease [Lactobacillus xujianguonis]|uniref:serine protease n=1 Tax=Lactobacillus xujianguonis TaxID=2495899 RepID=UPI001FEFBD16|nr:serine protease [Lactobacillus xujianguonis]